MQKPRNHVIIDYEAMIVIGFSSMFQILQYFGAVHNCKEVV